MAKKRLPLTKIMAAIVIGLVAAADDRRSRRLEINALDKSGSQSESRPPLPLPLERGWFTVTQAAANIIVILLPICRKLNANLRLLAATTTTMKARNEPRWRKASCPRSHSTGSGSRFAALAASSQADNEINGPQFEAAALRGGPLVYSSAHINHSPIFAESAG